jgi:outer membrane lipoprotein SlyB
MTLRATPRMSAILAIAAIATLAGCSYPGQNRYYAESVGQPMAVQFGTVVASRPIEIKGRPSGLGSAIGGAAGGLGGSTLGSGTGSGFAALGLAVAGLAAGGLAEQALSDRNGVEYTIVMQNGQTITVAQFLESGDAIIAPGHRVMVQSGNGYSRVLPAENIPTDLERPTGVTVH